MDTVISLLEGFLKLLIGLLVLGLSTERGTELLKVFWNSVTARYPILSLHDKRSFIFAGVIAFTLSYYFNVDLVQYIAVLDGFDPQLLELVNALLLTLVANKSHDKLFGEQG